MFYSFNKYFMSSTKNAQGYNDIYFRIIVALVAAHIIVAFGAKEGFFQLLISGFYYRSLLLSFVIAFALVSEVYFIIVKLDKRFDWKNKTLHRAGLQVVLGILLPSLTAFLLAAGYFALFGYNILNTYYLQFDFPVIVIMILLLNVYYLAFYFYKQWQLSEQLIANNETSNSEVNGKTKEIFVVQKGAKNIPLALDSICYFFHEGEYNFLRTCQREDFIVSQPLDDIQQQINEKHFFRVNRQMIVNFRACKHFEPWEYGKLKLFVTPETKEPVIISQKRAKGFKEWIER
jgi:hypothetical protein